MCREEASEHSSLLASYAACGIRLVAIAKETLGAATFLREFWKGELYLDESLGFYKAMFGGKESKVGLGIVFSSVWSNYARATRKGYSGDSKGEGR